MRQLVVVLLLGVALVVAVGDSATAAAWMGGKAASITGGKAAVGRVVDPREGRGPLDLAAASAQVRTRRNRNLLVLRLRTYGPWGTGDLVTRGIAPNGFTFEFSRRGVKPRCLDIRPTLDGRLMAQIIRSCFPIRFGQLGPPVRVRRTSRRGAETVIALRRLGRGAAGSWRWRAISSYEAAGHPVCSPPVYPPPEHLYGTCADFTRQVRIKGPPPARRGRR